MKRLDVNSALLCSVFSKASVFCKKSTTPILETVKVKVLKDVCILSSYDGENFILYRLPICCTDETDFSFCIPMQSGFLLFLKTLGNQSISLFIEGDTLKLRYKDRNMSKFPILDSSNFIEPKEVEGGHYVQINPEHIKNFLSSGKAFTSSDELRPIMGGVYLEVKDNKLTSSATDAHKLYVDSVDFENSEELSFIINQNAISAIVEMANGVKDGELLDFYVCNNNISITSNDCRIVCRNIEGRFPNFRAVIPNESNVVTKVRFVTSDFISLLNRMVIVTKGTKPLIKINIENGACKITCEDVDFNRKNEEVVECEVKGENMIIGLDASSLLSLVSNVQNEKFVMYIFAPDIPITIKEQGKNKVLLLSPMVV